MIERDPDFARLLRERFQDSRISRSSRATFATWRRFSPPWDRRGRSRCLGLAGAFVSPRLQQRPFSGRRQGLAQRWNVSIRSPRFPGCTGGFTAGTFDEVRFAFEPRNLPPGGAYFCRGNQRIVSAANGWARQPSRFFVDTPQKSGRWTHITGLRPRASDDSPALLWSRGRQSRFSS